MLVACSRMSAKIILGSSRKTILASFVSEDPRVPSPAVTSARFPRSTTITARDSQAWQWGTILEDQTRSRCPSYRRLPPHRGETIHRTVFTVLCRDYVQYPPSTSIRASIKKPTKSRDANGTREKREFTFQTRGRVITQSSPATRIDTFIRHE